MVFVPDVAPNVIAETEDEVAIPVDRVKFPYMTPVEVVFQVPAKPVKLTFLAVYPPVPRKVKAYVPAVKLKEIELASVI
jgi:hypothetical protein